jgi:hypothetical protein
MTQEPVYPRETPERLRQIMEEVMQEIMQERNDLKVILVAKDTIGLVTEEWMLIERILNVPASVGLEDHKKGTAILDRIRGEYPKLFADETTNSQEGEE